MINRSEDSITLRKLRSIGTAHGLDQCIVMPIHNSENHISTVLDALIACTTRPSILVIVFDACTDQSASKVFEFIDSQRKRVFNSSIKCIEFFISKRDLYESYIDNFALYAYPDAQYLISVQSDIVIKELAFDDLLVGALDLNTDLFMISGRGTHLFPNVKHLESIKAIVRRLLTTERVYGGAKIDPRLRIDDDQEVLTLSDELFFSEDYFGRCGVFHEHKIKVDERRLYLSETVIRGPLIYLAPVLRQIGGLDWRKHRLGNDDHSAALRGWRVLRMRTAYLPIAYSSPLDWGATRANKTYIQRVRYTVMRISERLNHVLGCEIALNRSRLSGPMREIRHLKKIR